MVERDLTEKVRDTIEKYRLLEKGDRVVIAVSGGPDSVCLLNILALLAEEYGLALLAAHLNHGLRGAESDRDEAFVRRLCSELGIPLESRLVRIANIRRKECLEEICREERYKYLAAVCRNNRFTRIALGHNLDDRVETILMNFLRGSGPEGLKGFMPMRDGIYIRPLFNTTRQEILDFLSSMKLPYVVDSSNESESYLRNRLRRRLIPELKRRYNPALPETVIRMSEIMRQEDEFIKKTAHEVLSGWDASQNGDEVIIPLSELLKCHEALRMRIIREILIRLSPSKKGVSYRHVASILDLVKGRKPAGRLDLPFRLEARRDYDRLIILRRSGPLGRKKRPESAGAASFRYPVEIPGSLRIAEAGMTIRFDFVDVMPASLNAGNTVYMDFEKMVFPLEVRNFRPGDRIQPFGMSGTKKVKDFFIDEKIPRARRRCMPLLVDRESVLWIVGRRLSEKIRVTNGTNEILRAEII